MDFFVETIHKTIVFIIKCAISTAYCIDRRTEIIETVIFTKSTLIDTNEY